MTQAVEHTQAGIAQRLDGGWVVACSCGWHSEPCAGPWRAGRRWDVHNAEMVLAAVGGGS